MHVSRRLLGEGCRVVGVDNLNDYYDVELKRARLSEIESSAQAEYFSFEYGDIAREVFLESLFAREGFTYVVHLAAQAGVRHSLEAPMSYVRSNVEGFTRLLEACRAHPVRHLLFASSSSVYGLNGSIPYTESQSIAHPVSLYAATKKSNELFAHAYSHLFGIPCTGLRFFTVYGPWGRPDMSPHLFASAILAGRPIRVFNQGQMQRDFTFIDDIVDGVVSVLGSPPCPDPEWDARVADPACAAASYRIFNIGFGSPVPLESFIDTLGELLGRSVIKDYLPMQPGDVVSTHADTSRLQAQTGYRPGTPLREGLTQFVEWYREYYRV